ncbi:hypothetical protein NUW58_g997 [Xylaria curta]|uniref:Uncharacterized protein n=1 Tax=Xylaria curta TaxID=42375 RepID=A0ACC1PNI6_9PEZI|nr:hypothetical protein NUW58_g997 [Xylaria curta]
MALKNAIAEFMANEEPEIPKLRSPPARVKDWDAHLSKRTRRDDYATREWRAVPSISMGALHRRREEKNREVSAWISLPTNDSIEDLQSLNPPPPPAHAAFHEVDDNLQLAEIPLIMRGTENRRVPGQIYFRSHGNRVTHEDILLMDEQRGPWRDPASLPNVILSNVRRHPETSQAAISKFRSMCDDNDSDVSNTASWGTRRSSSPEPPLVVGDFLMKYGGEMRDDSSVIPLQRSAISRTKKRPFAAIKPLSTPALPSMLSFARPSEESGLRLYDTSSVKEEESEGSELLRCGNGLDNANRDYSEIRELRSVSRSSPLQLPVRYINRETAFFREIDLVQPIALMPAETTSNTKAGTETGAIVAAHRTPFPTGSTGSLGNSERDIDEVNNTTLVSQEDESLVSLSGRLKETERVPICQMRQIGVVKADISLLSLSSKRYQTGLIDDVTSDNTSEADSYSDFYRDEDLPPDTVTANEAGEPPDDLLSQNNIHCSRPNRYNGALIGIGRGDQENDDSEGDEDVARLPKSKSPSKGLARFACPYQTHELFRTCLKPGRRNPDGGCDGIKRLKHMMSYRCQKCWKSFDSRRKADVHQEQQSQCGNKQKPWNEVFMSEDDEIELSRLSHTGGNEEDTWWNWFKLLIPNMRNREVAFLRVEYYPYYLRLEPSFMIPALTLPDFSFSPHAQATSSLTTGDENRLLGDTRDSATQRNYDRLKIRYSRVEAANTSLREANYEAQANLSRVEQLLEDVLMSEDLPAHLYEKVFQAEAIVATINGGLG